MNIKPLFTIGALALGIAAGSNVAYSAELEEIIVTAQKRAESLQDVPISMTALDGQRMEDAGVKSFAEMSSYVPNLEIKENPVNTIITMRGIDIGSNQSFEQSVGIYVDGIHYGKSRQVRTGLFDLQQVEVLRGPQGILFGKNTLAGAINVTSANPVIGDELNGKISLSNETDDGEIIEGNINATVTDTLAVRAAFRSNESDGYHDNSFAGARTPNSPTTDETIWRVTALWEPNEDTTVNFKHTNSDYVRAGSDSVITTFSPVENLGQADAMMYAIMGIVHPNFGTIATANSLDPYRDDLSLGGLALSQSLGKDLSGTEERGVGTDTQTDNTSLNINIDLANGYTFSSVTGLANYEYEDGIDADFLPLTFIGRSDNSEYEQTSQEFRIASPADQDFSFVAGAYWNSSEQEIDRIVAFDGTLGVPNIMRAVTGLGDPTQGTPSFLAISANQLAAGALAQQGVTDPTPAQIAAVAASPAVQAQVGIEGATMWSQVGRVSNWKQDTDSWAVFFQGTYNLTDELSLTAGVRYTEEDKEAYAKTDLVSNTSGLANADQNPLLAALMGGLFDSYAHEFQEERSTDQLMPAFNLQWKPSDTTQYYISYSEGFKSGGFNAVDDQNPKFLADGTILRTVPGVGFEYDDETAKSFEIGGKHTLLDGAMQVNWAAFSSEYDNQQVSTFVGLGFVVANAASSDSQGFEVDVAWQATEQLRLGASFALLDAEYNEFTSAGCTALQASALRGLGDLTPSSPVTSALGCQQQFLGNGEPSGSSQDLSGGPLGSDYSGTLTADYVQPLGNGTMWFAGIDINFSDGNLLTGDQDPIDYQEAYEKVNIRAGFSSENWNLMIYGRNITDEITASGGADVPLAGGSHMRYLEPGEVWGARVSFQF